MQPELGTSLLVANGTGWGQHHGHKPLAPEPKSGRPVQPVQPLGPAWGHSRAQPTGVEQGILKSDTRPSLIPKEYLIYEAATASDLPLMLWEV